MPTLTPPIDHRRALLALAQLPFSAYMNWRMILFGQGHNLAERRSNQTRETRDPKFTVIVETIVAMNAVRLQCGLTVAEFAAAIEDGLAASDDLVFSHSELSVVTLRLAEIMSIDGGVASWLTSLYVDQPAISDDHLAHSINALDRKSEFKELWKNSDAAISGGMSLLTIEQINAEVDELRGNTRVEDWSEPS